MRIIKPLKDGVLVKQDQPKDKVGSFYVPQGVKESYEDVGTVIAVGPGKYNDNGVLEVPSVSVGDRVLFRRKPASALSGEWDGHLMLADSDILGLVCYPE